MRLADVVLLARDVHALYSQKNHGSGNVELPIRLLNDGLVSIIGERTGLLIESRCLPWNGHMMRAALRRYKDTALILYSSDLNVCWSRFCICKEVYHLLSDEKTFSSDPVTLINGLLNQIPEIKVDEDVEAEWMAVLGAMELLVPHSVDSYLYNLEASGENHYEIALKFRVPEKIISLRLSPSIRKLLDDLHNGMH
ncbi:hypothetical protein [Ferrovum sp.]|uniref:hypothetical protein n=1 Tax=Ferrovum sp. TaxID=2609467 RepID=UPI0026080432|nr:hypothetical protein [Ferrovum sp.]